ncbi:exonuclease domain-containing protein [Oleisolibacter albus]|uniref:exonuclease domain-containing protein n=1 Tax=Oleisolibacter albus TaxID=2171757 RepID=UPI00138FB15D|nr:exonuclease domain-containing protein [Oleisolibacter albus]
MTADPLPPSSRLVAIDFETANESRASACAIGLAWIENGRVVRTEEFLIRPPELRFTPFTIAVHGIHPDDVRDAPEFPEIWLRLLPDLDGALLLAHNASFDMSVLRAMLQQYGLWVPEHSFLCTLVAARRLWPDLARHKLNYLAWHFGIELDHHKAGSDAQACAEIALRAMEHVGAADIRTLAAAAGLAFGSLTEGTPCRLRSPVKTPRDSGTSRAGRAPLPAVRTDPVLQGRHICFTGALASLTRGEAESLAVRAGLQPQSSVTRQTDFLVVGRARDTTKLMRARVRQAVDGRPLLLDEAEFRALLGLSTDKLAGRIP